LAGVVIGALLARSWGRRKWLDDNRASECRELLRAFTLTIHHVFKASNYLEAAIGSAAHEELRLGNDAYNESLRLMQDRIFIAKDIEHFKLRQRWVTINKEYLIRKDHLAFQHAYEEIQDTIVNMALNDSSKAH
jgi:hypothetical protein